MIRILEDKDPSEVYRNIYNLVQSDENSEIDDLHSVDINKTKDGYLNIAFDYKHDMRVMINIHPDGSIEIEAPDGVRSNFSTMIKDQYPQYEILD